MAKPVRTRSGSGSPLPLNEPSRHVARTWSSSERHLRRKLHRSDFVYDAEVAYGGISHLARVGGRPPIPRYLRELWQRRHFIWSESRSKVSTANAGNRLGSAWLVLRPLLDAAFYWLIFGVILNVGRGLPNYVAFVIIGIFMFQLTSSALSGGVTAIRQSRSMIRAFSFPRASIPVALVTRNLLERIPAFIVMFIMIAVIPPHAWPTPTWLLFPAILIFQTITDLGMMLLFARLGAAWPDLAQAMTFGTRILLYGSAVIFPIERFVSHPSALAIIEMNPVYIILTAYREILIDGTVPGPMVWLQLSAWALGFAVVGFLFFWQGEESYSRER